MKPNLPARNNSSHPTLRWAAAVGLSWVSACATTVDFAEADLSLEPRLDGTSSGGSGGSAGRTSTASTAGQGAVTSGGSSAVGGSGLGGGAGSGLGSGVETMGNVGLNPAGGAAGSNGSTATVSQPAVGSAAGAGGTAGAPQGPPPEPAAPLIDPSACDLVDRTGCEAFGCESAECPEGGACRSRCTPIDECLKETPTCITPDDPLCGVRGPNGTENTCTREFETGNGLPREVMTALIECLCQPGRTPPL